MVLSKGAHMALLPNYPQQLSVKDDFYLLSLFKLWHWFLADDQGDQAHYLDADEVVSGKVITRQAIVVAGLEEIAAVSSKFFPNISVNFLVQDADIVEANSGILQLKGKRADLLRFERPLLNFLGRMSGIATVTSDLVANLVNISVAATRKTLWGRIDKKAVVVGGGLSHRLSLGDAIMYKDNDWLNLADSDWGNLLEVWRAAKLVIFEVEKMEQLKRIAEFWEKEKLAIAAGVLLDNIEPDDLSDYITYLNRELPDFYKEASGNITKSNVSQYDIPGLDFVSLGSLTKHSNSADLSFELGASF